MDKMEVWRGALYHSRSLYIMVKKTWRNKLTAFMSTASRYSHASPDIIASGEECFHKVCCIWKLGNSLASY